MSQPFHMILSIILLTTICLHAKLRNLMKRTNVLNYHSTLFLVLSFTF